MWQRNWTPQPTSPILGPHIFLATLLPTTWNLSPFLLPLVFYNSFKYLISQKKNYSIQFMFINVPSQQPDAPLQKQNITQT